jgi:glycosyltransferase involved in cell wall biosynthesis
MSPPKKLSLIIPYYNEKKALARCIKRVLAIGRTDLRHELIIVDDWSTDKSLTIGQDLAKHHPQIAVLRHEGNRGKGRHALPNTWMNKPFISIMFINPDTTAPS